MRDSSQKQTSDDSPHFASTARLFTLALQTRNKGMAGAGFFSKTSKVHMTSASQPPKSKSNRPESWHCPARDCHALAMEWAMGTVDLIENHLGAMACLGMARNFAAAAWLSKKENGGQ